MHELPATQSILDIALKHAEQAHASRVTGLHIVVGQIASMVDDSVRFYWDIISKGTLAEGADLDFRRVPLELACLDCATRFYPGKEDFACPNCNGARVKVVGGEEFYLEAIDIEERTG